MTMSETNGKYTLPNGQFAPGNPGKPKGAKHKATLAARGLIQTKGRRLTQKAIQLALEGDLQALKLCLDRIVPVARDMPVSIDLSGDPAEAASRVLAAVSATDITPSEGDAAMR